MNLISIDEKVYCMVEKIHKIRLIVDCGIVEMGINNDIIISTRRAYNSRGNVE